MESIVKIIHVEPKFWALVNWITSHHPHFNIYSLDAKRQVLVQLYSTLVL